MASLLLDTNAVVPLLNRDADMQRVIASADEVLIPVIVIGELYFGAEKAARSAENIARIDGLVRQYTVLLCDVDTARWYGRVERQLRGSGTPIPPNDIRIAATALQHDLTLLTRDAHFTHVQRLRLMSW